MNWTTLQDVPTEVLHRELVRREIVPEITQLINKVAKVFGASASKVQAIGRGEPTDSARLAAMGIARSEYGYTLETLRCCFGRKDHSTIQKAHTRFLARIQTDKNFALKVREVLNADGDGRREGCPTSPLI